MFKQPFEKKWNELLREDNIEEVIKLHINEHKSFLDLIQRYAENLKRGGSVNILEIGCGTAIDSYYIADKTQANVWAIDISNRAIKVADRVGRYFGSKVNLKVADALKTDFKEGFFDLIFSQGVIEHFKNPIPIMKEQTRLLCDKGYLIIDVPQKYNIYALYRRLLTIMGKWPYGWERGYTAFELRKLGRQVGLKQVEVSRRGLTCELSKSKRPYIAILGNSYDFIMKNFYRYFHKFTSYFLQDVCSVFTKDKNMEVKI